MAFDRFLIAPLNTGLDTSLKPWLTPEDSFTNLTNAYVWRGRVVKRFGSEYMGAAPTQLTSRLRINIGKTDAAGDFTLIGLPGVKWNVGQMFSVASDTFTANVGFGAMLSSNPAASGTFNDVFGSMSITGATALSDVYYYPAEPVMGLTIYNSSVIGNQLAYAFDTQFAYKFNGSYWDRSGTVLWTGTDVNFFWATNWIVPATGARAMFVSNFYVPDPMYYFNGMTWISFTPNYKAPPALPALPNNYIQTARIIVAFHGSLLLLNTWEISAGGAPVAHPNRLRYSHIGDPADPTAYYEKNQVGYSGGGYIDAATDEAIVAADFVKDRLIVYFERSTWEIAWTGNYAQPFVWQRINTELGARSTFSAVPFDKYILAIGHTGVHSCSGANVERIDDKIPNEIFKIENNNGGSERVAGIRDYYAEMVYWTFSSTQNTQDLYPDRVLVYNYKNGTWSFNEDCITVFGYFEQQTDKVWGNQTDSWSEYDGTWVSGVAQAGGRQIIAGNQQGFVVVLKTELAKNAPSLQITSIDTTPASPTYGAFTIINHNLKTDLKSYGGTYSDYVKLTGMTGDTSWDDRTAPHLLIGKAGIYSVQRIDGDNIYLWWKDTTDPLHPVFKKVLPTAYRGGATLTRVSNPAIRGKQWNPYVTTGRDVYVAKIEFAVLKTSNGQVTVDYSPSSTDLSMLGEAYSTSSRLGNGTLETSPYTLAPLEKEQKRLWHPIYMQTEGSCIQIYISMNDAQMRLPEISEAALEIEGLILHTKPTTSRMT